MTEVNDQNFEEEVLKSDVPVLVDFWAPWCGPCQRMLPIMDELAKEMEGKPVKIVKMNVDENSSTPEKYSILNIPTFIVFRDGEVVSTLHGGQEKSVLADALMK